MASTTILENTILNGLGGLPGPPAMLVTGRLGNPSAETPDGSILRHELSRLVNIIILLVGSIWVRRRRAAKSRDARFAVATPRKWPFVVYVDDCQSTRLTAKNFRKFLFAPLQAGATFVSAYGNS